MARIAPRAARSLMDTLIARSGSGRDAPRFSRLPVDDLPERDHLIQRELASLPGAEGAEAHGPDPHADQADDRQPCRGQQPTDLAFPSLGHHDANGPRSPERPATHAFAALA